MDRQAASLLMIAAGLALTIYYYNLDRGQRNSLLAGLGGKARPVALPESEPPASRATGPFVGPPRSGGPPILPPAGVDWMGGMMNKFNSTLERTKRIFEELGEKPPYEIKPFPR